MSVEKNRSLVATLGAPHLRIIFSLLRYLILTVQASVGKARRQQVTAKINTLQALISNMLAPD